MNSKQYRMLQFKKDLRKKKQAGVPYVIWHLNDEQKEIAETEGIVTPFLYTIKTRHFHSIRNISSSLLKDIHYANKKGKTSIVRKLSRNEIQQLDEYNIKYKPIKFIIRLAG